MNKLTTIYNVMKNMKDLEKLAGEVEATVKKEDKIVFEVNKSFDRKKEEEGTKTSSSMKVTCGEESFEHQCSTTINGEKWNGFGKGFGHFGKGHGYCGGFGHLRKMKGMKNPEGEIGHFPMKNKLERLMIMIDLLNKAEIEKLDDGNKKLSLKLDKVDLSDEIKETIKRKCMYRHHMMHQHGMEAWKSMNHDGMSKEEILEMKKKHHLMGFFSEEMELKGLKADISISDKDYVEKVEINVELSDNENKEVKFALKGKIKEIS